MKQSVQFETAINGNTITIPKEYLQGSVKRALVIMLPEPERNPKITPKKGDLTASQFSSFRTDVKDFTFNREEANER